MPPVFKGWYYNDQWNNCPSDEQQAKMDAYLSSRGAVKIKEIDKTVNYVELFNERVAKKRAG